MGPNLYENKDVTPYIHAMTTHLPEMLKACVDQGLELGWFSATGLEKKNHLQVLYFDRKTFKGSISGEAEKAILQAEGRRILFMAENKEKLKKNGWNFEALLKAEKPPRILFY